MRGSAKIDLKTKNTKLDQKIIQILFGEKNKIQDWLKIFQKENNEKGPTEMVMMLH